MQAEAQLRHFGAREFDTRGYDQQDKAEIKYYREIRYQAVEAERGRVRLGHAGCPQDEADREQREPGYARDVDVAAGTPDLGRGFTGVLVSGLSHIFAHCDRFCVR